MRIDQLERTIRRLDRQSKRLVVDAIVREGVPIPPGVKRVLIVKERVVTASDTD